MGHTLANFRVGKILGRENFNLSYCKDLLNLNNFTLILNPGIIVLF